MKVVGFLSQKGGAGKTTLAVHTAVAAYEASLGVVLIDMDPQKSATVWGEARQGEGPVVATADVSDLRRVLDAAFNEWIEGTQIEPSTQFGRRPLDVTAEFGRSLLASPMHGAGQ